MFLRSVKAPNGRYEYLRLAESFRDGDRLRQRIVAHFGRKAPLAPHLDTLIPWLQSEFPCVAVDLGQRHKICVTRGSQHVTEVLRAVGINHLDPPSPPEDRSWLM